MKTLYANNSSQNFRLKLKHNMCLDSVFFLSIRPYFNPIYGSSIEQCSQLKKNDQSEFKFVLAESGLIKNKYFPFQRIWDAFIVTQNFIPGYLSIAMANCIRFLHHLYQKSIPDWSCLMLTKDKNVKRDTIALVMLFHSYLYDKLDDAL